MKPATKPCRAKVYIGLHERVLEALADAQLSRAELAAQLDVPQDNLNYAVWKLMRAAKVGVVRKEGRECIYGLIRYVAPQRIPRYVPEFRPLAYRPEACPMVRAALCLSIKR